MKFNVKVLGSFGAGLVATVVAIVGAYQAFYPDDVPIKSDYVGRWEINISKTLETVPSKTTDAIDSLDACLVRTMLSTLVSDYRASGNCTSAVDEFKKALLNINFNQTIITKNHLYLNQARLMPVNGYVVSDARIAHFLPDFEPWKLTKIDRKSFIANPPTPGIPYWVGKVVGNELILEGELTLERDNSGMVQMLNLSIWFTKAHASN